jgi:murein L,D-transpeptidase YafK
MHFLLNFSDTIFVIIKNMLSMKTVPYTITIFRKCVQAVVVGILIGSFCVVLPSPKKALASLERADKVIVIKSKRILMLMKDGEILKAYKVALGKSPQGRKIKAGDKRTPEGTYVLDSRNPDSRFHRAIHISYPNDSDVQVAQKLGVPPGGDIMIHGLADNFKKIGKQHRFADWTDGCIAVTNQEIEEIWQLVPDGVPIEIKP